MEIPAWWQATGWFLISWATKRNRFTELRIIKTKKQYQEYLDWIDKIFDKRVKPDTPDGEKLQVALLLIKQYEDAHYPVQIPDPVEAIKLKMHSALPI